MEWEKSYLSSLFLKQPNDSQGEHGLWQVYVLERFSLE